MFYEKIRFESLSESSAANRRFTLIKVIFMRIQNEKTCKEEILAPAEDANRAF